MTKTTSSLKTLKDENFIALNKKAREDLVIMFESDRAFIEQQIKNDSEFLRDLNIMDYSLLLCIEKRDIGADCQERDNPSEPQGAELIEKLLKQSDAINSLEAGDSSSSLKDSEDASTISKGFAPKHHHAVTYDRSHQNTLQTFNSFCNASRHQIES